MNRKFATLSLLAALGLSACASTEPRQEAATAKAGSDATKAVYVSTGSRLPPKPPTQPVKSVERVDWERNRGVIANQPKGN